MPGTAVRVGRRPRGFVGVHGPDAASYLQAMVSNDVEGLGPGESCDALLLTAKARVIAPMTVLRRGPEDFLLSTERGLGERVVAELRRYRFAAKAEIEPEDHFSVVVWDGDFTRAQEELDVRVAPTATQEELERARIEAGVPAWGKELDESILPAEAGLDRTHISFTKGCYPGQEPVARLHHRGHANRGLRVLNVDAEPGAEIRYDGTRLMNDIPVTFKIDRWTGNAGALDMDVQSETMRLFKNVTAMSPHQYRKRRVSRRPGG